MRMMTRRDALKLLTAGTGLLAGGSWLNLHAAPPAEGGPSGRRPNILLIIADDLGYGELGVQGCQDIPTPHIDSIARNGIRFTNGYVSAPICQPSRSGMMTGRYQQRFGVDLNPPETERNANSSHGVPVTEPMIAERLKALGYATGMLGKWHVGWKPEMTPLQRGFDEFFGFYGGSHSYLPHSQHKNREPLLRGTEPVREPDYLTDALGREAVAFIDKHKAEAFFLCLSFNAVHEPMESPKTYQQRFPHIKNALRRTHAGMTAAMDDAVGAVLATLRQHHLEEDTLIVFISDNGGFPAILSSNKPLRGGKWTVWEGGIRTPFMLQWKDRLPAGGTFELPVSALDLLPTAVAAAGGQVASDWKLDGVNLLPYLTGADKRCPHPTLYWRMGGQYAIRHGDWKMIVEKDSKKPRLFNLANDIGENTNLSAAEPEKLKELMALYETWAADMKPFIPRRADSREEE